MENLSEPDLDSVNRLINIERAVYIMKNINNPQYYRFGAIGVKNISSEGKIRQYNNLVRRLAQNSKLHDGGDQSEHVVSWVYAAVVVIDPEDNPHNSIVKVRKYENILRNIIQKTANIESHKCPGGRLVMEPRCNKKGRARDRFFCSDSSMINLIICNFLMKVSLVQAECKACLIPLA